MECSILSEDKSRCYFNTLIADIFCDVCVFEVKFCVVLILVVNLSNTLDQLRGNYFGKCLFCSVLVLYHSIVSSCVDGCLGQCRINPVYLTQVAGREVQSCVLLQNIGLFHLLHIFQWFTFVLNGVLQTHAKYKILN